MDLTEIVSITGVGGLHKVVGRRPTGLIVESLDGSNKKFATSMAQKVSFLADISMYTEDGDIKLSEVLVKLHDYVKGGKDLPGKDASNDEAKSVFSKVLPNFDQEKVYGSDIKKLFAWYNILKDQLDFSTLNKPDEETAEEGKEEGDSKEPKKVKSTVKKEVAPKTKTPTPKTTGAKGAKAATPRKTGSG